MRFGVISDIHGNLEALEAVLVFLKKERIDEVFCLGDTVGYGANPNECIDLLKATTDRNIAGNHDWAAVGLTDISRFNRFARAAITWTAQVLTEASKEFLRGLPLTLVKGEFLFVHGTPSSPASWGYLFDTGDARREFSAFSEKVCFIGHSHTPLIFAQRPGGFVYKLDFLDHCLEREYQYIINVGSVGQPRDLHPDAAFGICDTVKQRFTLTRVPYDIKTAQEKILKAGLPPILAERIEVGQ